MSDPMSIEVMEVKCIKEESDWESSVSKQELLEDLYADHKVKHELVLGPELLQQVHQPPAPHIIEVTVKIEEKERYEEETAEFNIQADVGVDTDTHYLIQEDLFTIQNCFVQVERMTLHKERYTCETCGKIYSKRSSLTRHMHIHAEKKPTVKKNISNSTTKNTSKETSALVKDNSIKKDTVDKPHKCPVCGKHFKLKALLVNHERTHTGEKPYSCKICDRRFTERSNLKRHERTHTGERPFSCEICKKQFSLKCNLMDHIRVHTKERPYSCDLCSKQFPDLSGLNRHKLIHTGYKKFTCDICKNKFARKHYLIDHMHTHHKTKCYVCEICSEQFENRYNLRAHKRQHKKHYLCEICDEHFSKVFDLKRHLLTHLA